MNSLTIQKMDTPQIGMEGSEPEPAPVEFFELLAEPLGLVQSCVLQLQSSRCQATVQLQQVSPQALGAILREVLL